MSSSKIISLLPAATEIVFELGLGDNLVGRSHECNYPDEVKEVAICTTSLISDTLSSGEIDRKVKEILANALSIYGINKELIKRLQPDVVITQDQCKVCAVSLEEVQTALTDFLDKEASVISVQPTMLHDIFDNIREIANALDVASKGELLVENMEERIGIIKHKLKYIENRPTVACIEWLDPLMISGNWIPEMVVTAGGMPVLAEPGEHSAYADWESIRAADADIMVLMPCGFAIERTIKEIGNLLQLPGFNELKAVKNNRFYIVDGNQYFNRPGPRIADSIEILAEIINPKQFIFGYEGTAWVKFDVTFN